MSTRSWKAILAAWTDAKKIVQKLPSDAGEADAYLEKIHGELSSQWLPGLRSQLRASLTADASDAGKDTAESARIEDEVQQVLVPLVVHLDELALLHLPPQLGPSWTRLQEGLIASDDGGVRFYENLKDLLKQPQPKLLVLEVYLFCLCEGFSGRYFDEPVTIADYKMQIARLLPAQYVKTEKSAVGEVKPSAPPKVLPAPVYYAVAVAAALLVILLLRVLAR